MQQVFGDIAEKLTAALVGGDFAAYRSVIALPLTITPRGGQAYVLETDAALALDFELYHAAIRTAGVTDIYREVPESLALEDGRLRVCFRVHILARSQRLADPFPSEMLLVSAADGLRISEITSAADHIDWTLGQGPLGTGAGLI